MMKKLQIKIPKIKIPKIRIPTKKLKIIKEKLKIFLAYLQKPLTVEPMAIGIDIGTRSIKMAKIRKKPLGYLLDKYYSIDIPPEVIVDREVMDRDILIENLEKLVIDTDIYGEKISTVMSGKNVILKKAKIKTAKGRKLKEEIKKVAQENIPFDIKEVVVDFKKLEERKDETDVVVIGAKNDAVYPLIDIFKDAKLLPYNIDAAPFAIHMAYEANKYIEKEGNYLLVNIGFEHTVIVVVKNSYYMMDEEIPVGIRNFVEEIQRICGSSSEDANRVLQGEEIEYIKEKDKAKAISNITKKLLDRITRILPEFYEWKKIILSGGGAFIPGIIEDFSKKFNAKCEIGDPTKELICKHKPEKPYAFDIAIGSAIAKLERKIINLIPEDERIKERNKVIEALDAGLPLYSLIFVSIIWAMLGWNLGRKNYSIEEGIKKMKKEQLEIAPRVKEVKELIEKEKILNRKVGIVQKLSKGRDDRIKLLDEINRLLPNYTWLTSINEEFVDSLGAIDIGIVGNTTTNFAVSEFMEKLKNSPYFYQVILNYTKKSKIMEVETTEFEIKAKFKSTPVK